MQAHFHFLVSPTNRLAQFIRTTVSWQSSHFSLSIRTYFINPLAQSQNPMLSTKQKDPHCHQVHTLDIFVLKCCWGWWGEGRSQARENLKVNLSRSSASPSFVLCLINNLMWDGILFIWSFYGGFLGLSFEWV